MKTLLLILSNKNSMYRNIQRQTLLKHEDFIPRYFIYDDEIEKNHIDEKRNIVYLKQPDTLSDSMKVYHALYYISQNFTDIDAIFKTRDDVKINLDELSTIIQNDYNYAGDVNTLNSGEYKYEDETYNIDSLEYCYDYGYFIKFELITNLLDPTEYKSKLDDVSIGMILNSLGIKPTHVSLIHNCCTPKAIKKLTKTQIQPPITQQPTYYNRPPTRKVEHCKFCRGEIQEIFKQYPPSSGVPSKKYKMCTKCGRLL